MCSVIKPSCVGANELGMEPLAELAPVRHALHAQAVHWHLNTPRYLAVFRDYWDYHDSIAGAFHEKWEEYEQFRPLALPAAAMQVADTCRGPIQEAYYAAFCRKIALGETYRYQYPRVRYEQNRGYQLGEAHVALVGMEAMATLQRAGLDEALAVQVLSRIIQCSIGSMMGQLRQPNGNYFDHDVLRVEPQPPFMPKGATPADIARAIHTQLAQNMGQWARREQLRGLNVPAGITPSR